MPQSTPATLQNFFSDSCLVNFSCSIWPASKQIPKNEITTAGNANKTWYRGRKQLIAHRHLKQHQSIKNDFKSFLNAFTLPFPLRGIERLPLSVVERISEKFQQVETAFNEATTIFTRNYENHIQEARENLNGLFNQRDYPVHIQDRFGIFLETFILDVPATIANDTVVTAQRERLLAMMQEAQELATVTLRGKFLEMVQHMRTRLTEGSRFHATNISNLLEFCDNFANHLNLNNDNALLNLTNQCKEYLSDVDVDEIRSDDKFREVINTQMASITTNVDALLQAMPQRRFLRSRDDESE